MGTIGEVMEEEGLTHEIVPWIAPTFPAYFSAPSTSVSL